MRSSHKYDRIITALLALLMLSTGAGTTARGVQPAFAGALPVPPVYLPLIR